MSHSTTKSRAVVSRRIDRAANSAHHLNGAAHDAKESISRNGERALEKVKSLRDTLQESKKVALTKVKRAAAAVRTQAVRVDKTIRAKPYQSLGVAAGAGLLAGYLISRKGKSA